MPIDRLIRRYTAFFEGWAQAFGNHRGGFDEARPLNWLLGVDVDQIGLILTPEIKGELFQRVTAGEVDRIGVTLGPHRFGIGDTTIDVGPSEEEAVRLLRWLLDAPGDLHLYQTYHLFYPAGTRIVTLSRVPPLAIIYRAIDPILVQET